MIFDEAHNVAGHARELASIDFSVSRLQRIDSQLIEAAAILGGLLQSAANNANSPLGLTPVDLMKRQTWESALKVCDNLQGFIGRMLGYMGGLQRGEANAVVIEYGAMCRCGASLTPAARLIFEHSLNRFARTTRRPSLRVCRPPLQPHRVIHATWLGCTEDQPALDCLSILLGNVTEVRDVLKEDGQAEKARRRASPDAQSCPDVSSGV